MTPCAVVVLFRLQRPGRLHRHVRCRRTQPWRPTVARCSGVCLSWWRLLASMLPRLCVADCWMFDVGLLLEAALGIVDCHADCTAPRVALLCRVVLFWSPCVFGIFVAVVVAVVMVVVMAGSSSSSSAAVVARVLFQNDFLPAPSDGSLTG